MDTQRPATAPPPPAMTPLDAAPAAAPRPRGTPTVVWLLVLLIISVAGAGLILSLDHPPTEDGRPELTARGHSTVAPRLVAMHVDAQRLAAAADGIAAAGRDTLTRLRALDATSTIAALDAGDGAAAHSSAVLTRMTDARATLLDGTSLTSLPASDRVQVGAIDAAIAAASQLPGYWQQVQAVASGPLDLLQTLDAHDEKVDTATKAGLAGSWAAALAALSDAQGLLRQVDGVRDSAHKTGLDVSTLDDLLDRLDTYDAALVDLYTILDDSNGQTTAASRAALDRVNAAQDSLPSDRSAMVLIISDLAGPTITPVLLSIESARGALGTAAGSGPAASDAVSSDAVSS